MNEMMQYRLTRERFYARDRRSVAGAREFAREAVADWGFGGRLDDVLLCVSELVTNALLHGVPPGRGFKLVLTSEELVEGEGGGRDGLRVEVHDSGVGVPRLGRPVGESGRGLLIVDAVADRWGVAEREPGKIVWCLFSHPG